MMEGRHPGRKTSQKEGFCLKDGKEGHRERSGTKGRVEGVEFQAEGKSPFSVGRLDLKKQEVVLRPWDKGHVTKACGFWALPNLFSSLEGPPPIHSNRLETPLPRPRPRQPPPCSGNADLLGGGQWGWGLFRVLRPAGLCCRSSPFFLLSLLKTATVFLVQRSVQTHCKTFLERQD